MLKITGAAMSGPDAIEYMEELTEFITDEMLPTHEKALNAFRYVVARDIPVEPKFYPGRVSRKYDSYTCGNCGFGLKEAYEKYCCNCGQRVTDAYLGRRKTREEQKEHTTPAGRAAIDEKAAMGKENGNGNQETI